MSASFRQKLQSPINPLEVQWSFRIPGLPDAKITNNAGLIKFISLVSNQTKNELTLTFAARPHNRAVASIAPDALLILSISYFRLRWPKKDGAQSTEPATFKESQDFVVRFIGTGIAINDVRYHFYAHSNSQLKSRTCFMLAGEKALVEDKIAELGDFSSMKTVAKKAKRIGLLFSSAEVATRLDPTHVEDIEDVERDGFTFTDGCGKIAAAFAKKLVAVRKISFRNRRYTPSVMQIRYRGYKGVLTLDTRLKGSVWAQFRKSMKKLSGVSDIPFAVVEYSKPYSYGHLNDEVIILLHSLGVSIEILLEKQRQHLQMLDQVEALDARATFQFLSYKNRAELAESLLLNGVDAVKQVARKLVSEDRHAMLNKRQEQRCRIFVKDSRLLFGICDADDTLKPGECFVRVTTDNGGQPQTVINTEVMVTRNPCLHPGDLQKFRAVDCPRLAHLTDCIVFSTRGRRPPADLMSGGDLDRDECIYDIRDPPVPTDSALVFVCWDKELIPRELVQPAEYPGPPEPRAKGQITHQDRLEYFARANASSLGKVKALYLEWARKHGPHCAECQQLNRLFSQCVDGNRIRIPPTLESPPAEPSTNTPFVLDVLHEASSQAILVHAASRAPARDADHSLSVQDFLMLDHVPLSEMETLQITQKWCLKNDNSLADFSHLFDYTQLSSEEKAWVSGSCGVDCSLAYNALTQSSILTPDEPKPFRLSDSRFHWKRVFDSGSDRMARFLDVATTCLEQFHRKLLVFRVDPRLSLAIYIPCKSSTAEETTIDDRVRVFAFPHTGDQSDTYRRAVSTTKNYKIFCHENTFQMYNNQRRDTWIFLRRAASDDSSYRNIPNEGDRRRQRQKTLDRETNHDFVASVALNKNSQGLAQHMGRVNRNSILNAEVYVITNRDTASMRAPDLWLEYIDRQNIHSNFCEEAREYDVITMDAIQWSQQSHFVQSIGRDGNFAYASALTKDELTKTFQWLLGHKRRAVLYGLCQYLLDCGNEQSMLLDVLVDHALAAPFLCSLLPFPEASSLFTTASQEQLRDISGDVLRALLLRASELDRIILKPFEALVRWWTRATINDYVDLFELVSLVVSDIDLTQDLIYQLLGQATSRLLVERPAVRERLIKSLTGLALEHVGEMVEARLRETPLLSVKLLHDKGDWGVKCEIVLRIDAPASVRPKMGDHIRLRPASAPSNNPLQRPTSIDGMVTNSEQGRVVFESFHQPPSFAEDCSWRLTHCASFTSVKAAFDATLALFQGRSSTCEVAHLVDGRSQQPTVRSSDLAAAQTTSPSNISDLNRSQAEAVSMASRHELTCLWGPPGTGKTHTILSILEQLTHDQPDVRILVTAPTNNAVDNILQRLIKRCPKLVSDLRAVRVATDTSKVARDIHQFVCSAFDSTSGSADFKARREAQKRVKDSALVFTTCIGAGLGLLRKQQFEIVLIDEASQVTEPASYVPLAKGCRKAILVGDHVQLRPIVGQYSAAAGFDESLFERLYRAENRPGVAKHMLDVQYRMHEDLCHFCSEEFYESKLKTGVLPKDRPVPASHFAWPAANGGIQRAVFIQCSAPEDLGQRSKSNAGQTAVCKETYNLLLKPSESVVESGPHYQPSIAILTPYTRQREALQAAIPEAQVSSIDGFQGKEADIVIFVTVRANVAADVGFLKDLRRLNVVMTRAKTGIVVIGDEATLTGEAEGEDYEAKSVWRRLLQRLARTTVGLPQTMS